jgi:hypothetical protein
LEYVRVEEGVGVRRGVHGVLLDEGYGPEVRGVVAR